MLHHTYTACLDAKIFLRYYYVHTRRWRVEYVGGMGVYAHVQYAVCEHYVFQADPSNCVV